MEAQVTIYVSIIAQKQKISRFRISLILYPYGYCHIKITLEINNNNDLKKHVEIE